MNLDPIKSLINEDLQAVNELINEHLQSPITLITELGQHIIFSGGKRLRPMLALLSARACGYRGKQHITLATLVEFIHTATLLHDDVVDDSLLRRGKQTANAIWGNEASVLVGDFLFSRAFQLMVTVGDIRVMDLLANVTNTIAAGEVMQLMNAHDPDISEAIYMEVIHAKTATLFYAATQAGAILSQQPEPQVQAMRNYGTYLGNAFQLVDDILDYQGNAAQIGKNIGDDLAQGKTTLPVIYALQNSPQAQREQMQQAIRDGDLDSLEIIQQAIASTNAIEYTYGIAQQQAELAMNALTELPESVYRTALNDLARFAISREF